MSSTTVDLAIQRIEIIEKQMQSLISDKIKYDKKEKKEEKKEKKEKKKSDTNSDSDDSNKKKKKMSGYLMHNANKRPIIKEAMEKEIADANKVIESDNIHLPEDDHKPLLKLKSTDVLSRLAVAWKALDDTERSNWNTDAAQVDN
jgi:hypothetical protein